ncbi:AIR synthase-related protein, partial [Methanothrix sp.]|uniref:AIR synthase-related protein n=1 Tax=Methanothrix sp. TaxID=90426 RepID=UPI0034E2C759
FGGSILDAVTGCGGIPPPIPDIEIVRRVCNLVDAGVIKWATDLSQGGLLAALASISGGASIRIEGDPLEMLFSESYGRFLAIVEGEVSLAGIPSVSIGEAGGGEISIKTREGIITLSPEELEGARNSLNSKMRY